MSNYVKRSKFNRRKNITMFFEPSPDYGNFRFPRYRDKFMFYSFHVWVKPSTEFFWQAIIFIITQENSATRSNRQSPVSFSTIRNIMF